MNSRARRIVAGAAGILSALITVAVIEYVGHSLYPPPENLDFSDHNAVAAFIRSLPTGAFGFVLSAWAFGVLDGTLVAIVIARARAGLYATLIGGVVLIAALVNLTMFPHPMWFQISAIVLIATATLTASLVGQFLLPARN
ncbi:MULTISPECIES: hypothetical protein [Oleiagrimonas]|uniref:Uncharacterized protein n=1 Tax=Oleiagrimonas citrea TaxID=1665687 RepID=A0A846ZMF7_9GAMM|nr:MULTISPECIES: hypothetical protein [Oleiagrimonas]NKZ39485.1 hypothetical protein [Oleiagrimonas citrea]